jgi:hypothetical protein
LRATKSAEFGKALVIGPQNLRRLSRLVSEYTGALRFSVDCDDGSTLHPTSLDELLDLPNPVSTAINRVRLSSAYSGERTLNIVLDGTSEYRAGSYEAGGEDSEVYFVTQQIEQEIESCTQWYSWIAKTSSLKAFIAGGAVPFGALVVAVATGLKGTSHLLRIVFAGIGFLLITIPLLSARIKKAFFPYVVFRVGDGEARYVRLTDRRRNFGVSLVVAVVVSFVIGIIVNEITK